MTILGSSAPMQAQAGVMTVQAVPVCACAKSAVDASVGLEAAEVANTRSAGAGPRVCFRLLTGVACTEIRPDYSIGEHYELATSVRPESEVIERLRVRAGGRGYSYLDAMPGSHDQRCLRLGLHLDVTLLAKGGGKQQRGKRGGGGEDETCRSGLTRLPSQQLPGVSSVA